MYNFADKSIWGTNHNLLQVASNGRNVFMGYLGDATKTRETFDRGFWLLSGDMATIDQGFVTIKGES